MLFEDYPEKEIMNQNIVYEIGGKGRPHLNRKMKIVMFLHNIPYVSAIMGRIIRRYFNMPKTTSISPGFFCSAPLLELGENVGLGDTFIVAYAPVRIGNNVSMSFKNLIITSTHDPNKFSTVIGKPITIGDNVWITTNCTILGGVTIGENTIIGAGSVVTKDIPANVFAAGNPCKVIKEICFKK